MPPKTSPVHDTEQLKKATILALIIRLYQYVTKQGFRFETTVSQLQSSQAPLDEFISAQQEPGSELSIFHAGLLTLACPEAEAAFIQQAEDEVNQPLLALIESLDIHALLNTLPLSVNQDISEEITKENELKFTISLLTLYTNIIKHIQFDEANNSWKIDSTSIIKSCQHTISCCQDASLHQTPSPITITPEPATAVASNTEQQQKPEPVKQLVTKRELDDKDRAIYAQATNNSLIGKKQRGLRIKEDEFLTDQDINTAIQLLGLPKHSINVTFLTIKKNFFKTSYTKQSKDSIENLGQVLHFARDKHARGDSASQPYLVPYTLANWDFDGSSTFQGGHWTTLLIKVTPTQDPEQPRISVEYIDSMSSLSLESAKDAINQMIRYHEESINDNVKVIFHAFPKLKKANLQIKVTNQNAQRDSWSCGYMALHTAFCALVNEGILPQASLNDRQLAFYNCKTSVEKRDFIYNLFDVKPTPPAPFLYTPRPTSSRKADGYPPHAMRPLGDFVPGYRKPIRYQPNSSIKNSCEAEEVLRDRCAEIISRAKLTYDTFFLTVDVERDYNLFIQKKPHIYVTHYMNALLAFLSIEHKKSFALSSSLKGEASSQTPPKEQKELIDTPFNGVQDIIKYIELLLGAVTALPFQDASLAQKHIVAVIRAHILEKITDTTTDTELLSDYLHRLMRRLNTIEIQSCLPENNPIKNDYYFSHWLTNKVPHLQELKSENLTVVQYKDDFNSSYPSAVQITIERIDNLTEKSIFSSKLASWQYSIAAEITTVLKNQMQEPSKILVSIKNFSQKIIAEHKRLKHSLTMTMQDPLLKTLHYFETLIFTTASPMQVLSLLPYRLQSMATFMQELMPDARTQTVSDIEAITTQIKALETLTEMDIGKAIPQMTQKREFINEMYPTFKNILFSVMSYGYAHQAAGEKPPKSMVSLITYCHKIHQELDYIFSQCPLTQTNREIDHAIELRTMKNRLEKNYLKNLSKKKKSNYSGEKIKQKVNLLAADRPSEEQSLLAPDNSPKQTANANAWWLIFTQLFSHLLQWARRLLSTESGEAASTSQRAHLKQDAPTEDITASGLIELPTITKTNTAKPKQGEEQQSADASATSSDTTQDRREIKKSSLLSKSTTNLTFFTSIESANDASKDKKLTKTNSSPDILSRM